MYTKIFLELMCIFGIGIIITEIFMKFKIRYYDKILSKLKWLKCLIS